MSEIALNRFRWLMFVTRRVSNKHSISTIVIVAHLNTIMNRIVTHEHVVRIILLVVF